jgi:hypothetical protein
VNAELAMHFDMLVEDGIRRGLGPSEARAAASSSRWSSRHSSSIANPLRGIEPFNPSPSISMEISNSPYAAWKWGGAWSLSSM